MKKAIYKVPNGKLLKIFLENHGGKIKSLKITGDFFLYPEENIEKMETHLCGTELNKDKLSTKLDEFLQNNPTNLFGLDKESLVATIMAAANS